MTTTSRNHATGVMWDGKLRKALTTRSDGTLRCKVWPRAGTIDHRILPILFGVGS